jgi:integrase
MTSTVEGDERGVKNDGSRRLIPLHPALIDRGFLRYVETVRSADGQLFPKLKPNPAGYYGASFGKRWAIYLREVVKLETTVPPMHGFRHTFKTLCRGAGIDGEVSDAITGHAGGNRVARGYGSMPLERMATEIARLPKA